MFYIIAIIVFVLMSSVVVWFIYSTAKEIGELEGILKAEEEHRKKR